MLAQKVLKIILTNSRKEACKRGGKRKSGKGGGDGSAVVQGGGGGVLMHTHTCTHTHARTVTPIKCQRVVVKFVTGAGKAAVTSTPIPSMPRLCPCPCPSLLPKAWSLCLCKCFSAFQHFYFLIATWKCRISSMWQQNLPVT